jgi:hypothetical protein
MTFGISRHPRGACRNASAWAYPLCHSDGDIVYGEVEGNVLFVREWCRPVTEESSGSFLPAQRASPVGGIEAGSKTPQIQSKLCCFMQGELRQMIHVYEPQFPPL